MVNSKDEKRKYGRYDTEVKIYFQVTYPIETIVKFRVVDKEKDKTLSEKYSALSKNVSAEGLCFTSQKKLETGDILHLEVYLPSEKNPIPMKGEVRWSSISSRENGKFDTGVRLLTIDSQSVPETIYFDKAHRIAWSAVLESIFGNFRLFAEKMRKTKVN